MKILTIGNSFTENALSYFNDIVKSAGDKVEVETCNIGGGTLEQHWQAVLEYEKDKNSDSGKIYYMNDEKVSLKEKLIKDDWDYITLQQQSLLCFVIESYEPFIGNLIKYIKQYSPNTEIILHRTWAYRKDAQQLKIYNLTQAEMHKRIVETYKIIAEKYNLKVIPVGDAFDKVRASSEWSYKEATNLDEIKYPDLPNDKYSLNNGYYWDEETKELKCDPTHASIAGEYLAGMIWYKFFFNKKIENLKFQPKELDEKYVKFLKECTK